MPGIKKTRRKHGSNSKDTPRISLNLKKVGRSRVGDCACPTAPPYVSILPSSRPRPQSAFDDTCPKSRSMSTLVKGPALESQIADQLRQELMPETQNKQPREQPFYKLSGTSNNEKILKEYIETTARQYAAQVLNTTPDNITLEQSYQIVYTYLKRPITQVPKESTAGKAVIILALGRLDNQNGLPGFADTTESLESGELLGTVLDRPQTFKGYGGGCGHISIWIRK
ncbi:hypothetical protein B0J14DRAFT_170975 [Halenospora varia]|nr:hypothetical protein B0J14DRAFT_170975 [Halenospora varia]